MRNRECPLSTHCGHSADRGSAVSMFRSWYVIMALAGCSSGAALLNPQVGAADEILEARKQYQREHAAEIETARRECFGRGGQFGYRGLASWPICTVALSDAGKACRSSSECQGECIVDFERRAIDWRSIPQGTPMAGECTAVSPHLGCYLIIHEGRTAGAMCAD
jgi:hypothetical protein